MTNLYRRFAELFAPDPLLVGEVVSTDAAGVAVELPDGALIRARGTAAIGASVFVRAGAIEGQAPSATVTELEV